MVKTFERWRRCRSRGGEADGVAFVEVGYDERVGLDGDDLGEPLVDSVDLATRRASASDPMLESSTNSAR